MLYKSFIFGQTPLRMIFRSLLQILFFLSLVAVTYFIGCSETHFGSVVINCDDLKTQFKDGNCTPIDLSDGPTTTTTTPNHLLVKYGVDLGQVDMVFIMDNSPSMYEEQVDIGRQMRKFLYQVRNLDYRIAVTTTDISASPGNPSRNQYYQDGRFIPMNGKPYIENLNRGGSVDQSSLDAFISAIQRPESLACAKPRKGRGLTERQLLEQELGFREGERVSKSNIKCPSSDERAIYAANLAVESYSNTFFRNAAHLMFIIISDEDERSSDVYIRQQLKLGTDYEFETRDYPETLAQTVAEQLGELKTFSAHSVIIRPGDTACLRKQQQNAGQGAGTGAGYYGYEYARLSKAGKELQENYGNLLQGSVISICDRNYSQQLGKIAFFAEVPRIPLACDNPENIEFQENGRKIRVNYTLNGRSLEINDNFHISSHITISMICKKHQF